MLRNEKYYRKVFDYINEENPGSIHAYLEIDADTRLLSINFIRASYNSLNMIPNMIYLTMYDLIRNNILMVM
jgi:hypothetical protein